MARTRNKKVNRGVILFAFNSPRYNYYKMAEYTAKRVNHFLNLPKYYILNPNYDTIEERILTKQAKPKESSQNKPQKGINRGNFATSWK